MARLRHFGRTPSDSKPAAGREGFLRSEDGSLIIFGLMIFIMILTVGGMGVDFMRYETHRAQLQATLDRAILAAASLDQPLEPEAVVLDYFDRAGLGDYIDVSDITVTESANSRYVEARVTMPVQSTFLNFVGITELDAPATGAAQQMASDTEVSLVLDVSGSMGYYSSGSRKIDILKDAATQFINITTCDPSDPDKTTDCTVPEGQVSISIVPYSEQVLAGETLLDQFDPTMEHTYSSCANFDSEDFQTTSIYENTVLQRTGHFDPWSSGDTAYSWTCKTDSWREITAVEGDGDVLRSHIASLSASGNTSIDLGMKWGTALLDPAAQPAITDVIDANFEQRPLAWTERAVEKVIVLMTDGMNTSQHYLYDDFRSGPSPYIFVSNDADQRMSIYDPVDDVYYWVFAEYWEKYPQDRPYGQGDIPSCTSASKEMKAKYWNNTKYCSWVSGPGATAMEYPDIWAEYSWSWWEDWGFLPTPGSWVGTSEKNQRLQDICDAAKAQDITVFTIGFETNSTADAILQDCASSDAHYFDVDGLDLTDAFASIAREISKLKLVN